MPRDPRAGLWALSLSASAWAALGILLLTDSRLLQGILLWVSPVLCLGALVLAALGLRARPVASGFAAALALAAGWGWRLAWVISRQGG